MGWIDLCKCIRDINVTITFLEHFLGYQIKVQDVSACAKHISLQTYLLTRLAL